MTCSLLSKSLCGFGKASELMSVLARCFSLDTGGRAGSICLLGQAASPCSRDTHHSPRGSHCVLRGKRFPPLCHGTSRIKSVTESLAGGRKANMLINTAAAGIHGVWRGTLCFLSPAGASLRICSHLVNERLLQALTSGTGIRTQDPLLPN